MRSAFTLIELLIVIAIIAILSIVVVLSLNPAEMLRQGRDANRVSDLDTLTHALSLYQADQATAGSSGPLGTINTVYVSLPDPTLSGTQTSTCGTLGLLALPSGYSYQCSSPQSYRKTNGNGWIPLNFSNMTTGSPLGTLPIDPTNASSSRLYYTYTTNGSQFEVTSGMESQKYKPGGTNDQISGDGGTLASVYEKGSKLGLEPLDYGDPSLVGYWTFEEGTGTVAYDYSGNNATGSWMGTPTGTNGYYSAGKVGGWAGAFDGTDNYVSARFGSTDYPQLTVSAWVSSHNPSGLTNIVNGDGITYYASVYGSKFQVFDGVAWESGTTALSADAWYYFTMSFDSVAKTLKIYTNGNLEYSNTGTATRGSGSVAFLGTDIGDGRYLQGKLDDVRFYNRVLSAAEIAALYAGGK
jgi:prepilin-type N-terminal cleavage/methylation domain-containing protein